MFSKELKYIFCSNAQNGFNNKSSIESNLQQIPRLEMI